MEQENISYEENASGLFHGFNAKDALAKLIDEMKNTLKQDKLEKIWGNCYVWHDDKLNDVDDEPAITLIKQLSVGVKECQSYKPVDKTPVGSAVSSTGGYKKSYGKKKKTKKTRRKTKNMRKKSKSKTKTKKKSTRKKKHYKKRKSKTHKKR